jgi:hypothetical protein
MHFLLFSLLQFSVLLSAARHEFHVSITHVNYSEAELQATMRVFTDDLEMQIERDYGLKLQLGEEGQDSKTDSILSLFLQRHFALETEGRPLAFHFLGAEREVDMTYLYFFYPCAEKPQKLRISNQVFFDSFEDQSNIVNVKVGEELRSAFLTSAETEKTVEF